jgi:tetratricopeptide (TPR) repeat protein
LTRVRIAVARDCDLAAAERLLVEARRQFPDNDFAKLQQRHFALQIGDAQTALVISDDLASTPEGAVWERGQIEPGQALLMAGRLAEARRALQDSRDAMLQGARAEAGHAGNQFATAAAVSALLGERERAIEYAERSLELMPTLGAWNRKEALMECASALAHVGEIPAAIERLRDWFAEVPSPVKASGLWCDAGLAPLRADARFRKLIEEHGGNTSVDPFNRATWPRATATAATAQRAP